MKFKTPYEQLSYECKYQIISREIEIEILQNQINKLTGLLLVAEDKRQIEGLNSDVAKMKAGVEAYRGEISYFQEKLDIAQKKIL